MKVAAVRSLHERIGARFTSQRKHFISVGGNEKVSHEHLQHPIFERAGNVGKTITDLH